MASPYYQAHGQKEVFKLENGVLRWVSEYTPELAGRNMVPLSWFAQYPIEGSCPNRSIYEGAGAAPPAEEDDWGYEGGAVGRIGVGVSTSIHLMYGVDEGQNFNRVRDAGVNLIFDYGHHGISYLNKAQSAGLYVLHNLKFLTSDRMAGKSAAEQWNIWNNSKAEMANLINQVKGHPALYAHYIFEEPNLTGRGIPLDLQQDVYNFVKSIDPNHAVAFSMAGGPGDLGYRSINFNACDFIIPDTYGFGDPGSGGLADLNFAASSLRSYLDTNGIHVPVVFTIQACSDPGTGWQGQIEAQINILQTHNVATGGMGMYAWNLTEGGGSSDRTWNEILGAWGTSDWGPTPPGPTPPGPEPPEPEPTPPAPEPGGNPYYQAHGEGEVFKLGNDGILRWQDEYDPLMAGRNTVPIDWFYGRRFDTSGWGQGWIDKYKPGSGVPEPPTPPPEPPTPPPEPPEPPEPPPLPPEPPHPPPPEPPLPPEPPPILGYTEEYLGHIFPERPEIRPPKLPDPLHDPWGQRPYEATWLGGQQETWPAATEPTPASLEGEDFYSQLETLGQQLMSASTTISGTMGMSFPSGTGDFASKLDQLGQSLISSQSDIEGLLNRLGG